MPGSNVGNIVEFREPCCGKKYRDIFHFIEETLVYDRFTNQGHTCFWITYSDSRKLCDDSRNSMITLDLRACVKLYFVFCFQLF